MWVSPVTRDLLYLYFILHSRKLGRETSMDLLVRRPACPQSARPCMCAVKDKHGPSRTVSTISSPDCFMRYARGTARRQAKLLQLLRGAKEGLRLQGRHTHTHSVSSEQQKGNARRSPLAQFSPHGHFRDSNDKGVFGPGILSFLFQFTFLYFG